MPERRFLSAQWRNLLMLNYPIDRAVLRDRVPPGCELDDFGGRTFASVVGFQFLDTRVLGVPIPWHRDFEEVNLRFYVRRKVASEWRRGVVFVREIVPRRAIALVARHVYGEPYVALPMRHRIESTGAPSAVRYEWLHRGCWASISARFAGKPVLPDPASEESFITEHYWGYSRQSPDVALEYQVEHPRWSVWHAREAALHCDVAALYGPEFAEALAAPPSTAFVADGSPITVRAGRRT